MEGSQKKRWPLGLIKRGVKMADKGSQVIWWQEPEPPDSKVEIVVSTVEAAREIGYEAYYMIPVSYGERLAGSAENLLREVHRRRLDPALFEDLQLVVDSFRDNVRSLREE